MTSNFMGIPFSLANCAKWGVVFDGLETRNHEVHISHFADKKKIAGFIVEKVYELVHGTICQSDLHPGYNSAFAYLRCWSFA